ncbi:LysR substrate-binding domain-containing protein [Cupriavidus sp. 8B]
MELRQLKYFVCIVEAGSVSRAAQILHVAQPALSAQINRLEEELGARLLVRSVRGVVPTEAGAAVLVQAQRILKEVEATRIIALQADREPSGPVAVGLPWTVRSVLGLTLLETIKRTMPAVQLAIVEGPSSVLAGMLAHGKLDVAVVFDNAPDDSLSLKPLVVEPLLLVGQRGALQGWSVATIERIAQLPLLLLSKPNGIREEVERQLASRGLAPNVVAEINSPALLMDAVQAGLGFSVLPSCGIEQACREARLDAVPLEADAPVRTVFLAISKLYSPSMAAERVCTLIETLTAEAVSGGRWHASRLEGDAADSPATT